MPHLSVLIMFINRLLDVCNVPHLSMLTMLINRLLDVCNVSYLIINKNVIIFIFYYCYEEYSIVYSYVIIETTIILLLRVLLRRAYPSPVKLICSYFTGGVPAHGARGRHACESAGCPKG